MLVKNCGNITRVLVSEYDVIDHPSIKRFGNAVAVKSEANKHAVGQMESAASACNHNVPLPVNLTGYPAAAVSAETILAVKQRVGCGIHIVRKRSKHSPIA